MIYRVIVIAGYSEACFDFDFITEAGQFAETILTHATDANSEDIYRKTSVRILVLKSKDKEENNA